MKDESLVLMLVPELLGTAENRYEILRQISALEPVGRHLLAVATRLPEADIRRHLTVMKEQGLIESAPKGICLSRKGESLLASFSDVLYRDPKLNQMGRQLGKILSMKQVIVVSGDSTTSVEVKKKMAEEMAFALAHRLRDGNIVAVGGGRIMSLMADALPELHMDVTVVPARGGFGAEIEYQANMIASKVAKKVHGSYRMLHIPDGISPGLIQRLRSESPDTAQVESLIHRADILAVSIGTSRDMAAVHGLPVEVKDRLHREGAVGETLGLYADEKGNVILRMYNIGISPDDIQSVPHVLIAAGGSKKARAILAMARAGVRGILITDEGAAREIINLAQ
jgi:central glycolytic genes regulator